MIQIRITGLPSQPYASDAGQGGLDAAVRTNPFFRNVCVVELLICFTKVNEGLGNGNDNEMKGGKINNHPTVPARNMRIPWDLYPR